MRGATLIETCAALALATLAANVLVAGFRPLTCSLKVEAARGILQGALYEARRQAFLRETSVAVATPEGGSEVLVGADESRRDLGDGVRLVSVPSDGNVLFHASGLADNATVRLACDSAAASVVVNQRGVIR